MRKKVKRILIFIILPLIINSLIYVYIITKHDLNIYGNSIIITETILVPEQNKIPILMYHHLTYDSEQWNSSNISPDQFKKEMLYLKALGYSTINFEDYIEFKENGKKLPNNPIIITFDDGYYSNYEYAYPILKELNMKATISIIGWSVGREYDKDNLTPISRHFSWKQAKEMYDSGLIDIQNHSYDLHSNSNYKKSADKLPTETQAQYVKRFKEDTLKTKKLIESNLKNKVIVYTYPLGIYNDTTEKILKELGFKVSLTTENGVSDFNNGLYLLKRINMPSIKSQELINGILQLQNRNIKIPFNIYLKVHLMFLLSKNLSKAHPLTRVFSIAYIVYLSTES